MKGFYLLPVFVVLSVSLFAQSFNIGVSGGYNFPLAGEFHIANAVEYENQNFPHYYATLQKLANVSYGQGGNVAVNVDWFSKADIGAGLKLNALISSPKSYSVQVNYLNGVSANYNYTDKGFSVQFIPHLNFKHDFKKVSPFMEMGMLVGITSVGEQYTANASTGDIIFSKINAHGNVLLGFYSSLGIAVRITDVIKFTAAVSCSAGSYSPARWSRKVYTVNYIDQMNYLSVADKQGVFVKQLDLTATQSSNQPHQELKESYAFTNLGINVGICFVIGKKKDETKSKEIFKDSRQF